MFYAANFQQEQRESLTVLCQRGRATSLFGETNVHQLPLGIYGAEILPAQKIERDCRQRALVQTFELHCLNFAAPWRLGFEQRRKLTYEIFNAMSGSIL